jgi:hypothetical protein
MLRAVRLLPASTALTCLVVTPLFAQDGIRLRTHALFYGDNTEFRNPFREGETIFGAAARVAVEMDIGERSSLTLGVFGNQRFGSEDAFEQVRPILSLIVRGNRSAFIFGVLPPSRHSAANGPDLNGPHGLLPPLQRETLTFDRPYEAGLQWTFTGTRLRQDAWLNWQRLNTREHRERLDAGTAGDLHLAGPVALPYQMHIVHEGGQLFSAGPVADSVAGGLGIKVRDKIGRFDDAALEAYVLASRFVPDRASPLRSRSGAGLFSRASAELAGWRGHLLFWRGDDFIKDEGDPNYLSIRRDGSRYRGIRDYSEAGITRIFRPAAALTLQASVRIHRIERHYEYSYRILGVTSLDWSLRKTRNMRSVEYTANVRWGRIQRDLCSN